jgi:hypothetical protein
MGWLTGAIHTYAHHVPAASLVGVAWQGGAFVPGDVCTCTSWKGGEGQGVEQARLLGF